MVSGDQRPIWRFVQYLGAEALTFSVLLSWTFKICQTSQIFTLENPKATIILEWRGYIWIYIVHEYILKNMQLTSVHAWFRYNPLGCKKKLDMRMNVYSMFKLTTKIDAPFYIWFTNAIISGSNRWMHFVWIRIFETAFMLNSTCILFRS